MSIVQAGSATVSNPDADSTEVSKRRRSGSETRQRNRQYKLSLLPQEEQVLQQLADEEGLPNIQQYILRKLIEPAMAAAT